MNRGIIAILGVILLVAAWFFASPLYIDKTVDEDFDFIKDDGHVDMKAVMGMPSDKRLAMMPDIMDAAASAPDRSSSEAMPTDAPEAIAKGQFIDADAIHKGSGEATLYAIGDDQHVVRFENFRTTNGPALVVYLAKHPSPTETSHVKHGGYLKLGKLKGNVGNQNYLVPLGTNISEYNSVVIWCELFDVLFSPAGLTPIRAIDGTDRISSVFPESSPEYVEVAPADIRRQELRRNRLPVRVAAPGYRVPEHELGFGPHAQVR